ncbi:hypothetical protein [Bacillus benzoevorans]|uniref:Type II secretory pathway component PulJ n=1 Tax=Bacillus benzoevorans TaxID=1456 RepID=A0A7X0LWU8_9BACI|nr:hypothetical protein [Bacillus benzoevorans]MBB6445857.1 type II secretory pathway component PulJ [Bacillus benzoevorans]
MKRKILSSAKGLTLVELLLSLSLIGVVSVLIIGVLVSGMDSYRSVNKQISLHDEANAIMTKFSNEIFVATKVEPNSVEPVKEIHIKKYGSGDVITTLGFAGGNANINGAPINSPFVTVEESASSFAVDEENGIVHIHLELTDDNNRSFQLTEDVTYVKVE